MEKEEDKMQMQQISQYLKCLTNKRQLVPLKEEVTKFLLLSQEYAVKYKSEMDVACLIRFLAAF